MDCLSCKIVNGEIPGVLRLATTTSFDVHQDYEVKIPGFIIITSKRHIHSIDEMSPVELVEFVNALYKIRHVLREVLGITSVNLFQKDTPLKHFHFWVFPRYEWMDEKYGTGSDSMKKIIEDTKSGKLDGLLTENLSEVISKLKNSYSKIKI